MHPVDNTQIETLPRLRDRTFVISEPIPLKKIVDTTDGTVTYVGEAKCGTGVTDPTWRIQKIAVAGAITTITWADGNALFDNIWDNRATSVVYK